MKYDEVMAGIWRDNVLFTVLLELTYKCNLDCFFCYNDLSMRGRSMRLPDYVQLFDDLEAMHVMTVTLSGGEPLAHPDFFEIGRAAHERGFVVRVKSNGHALRGDLVKRLRTEVDPFIVEVSLHGCTAATHDRQTRVPGSFDRLMENLRGLREAGQRLKLNSTLTLWNENELEAMYAIADSFGAEMQVDPTVTPRDDRDTSPLSIAPSSDGLRELVKVQAVRARKTGVAPPDRERSGNDSEIPSAPDKHCGAGSMTVAVDPYGNVYPCVAWRESVGNLHEVSIREIWETSAKLPEVRGGTVAVKTMLEGEGELGKFVNFCPGLALNRTGRLDVIPEEQLESGRTLLEATNALKGPASDDEKADELLTS